MAKLTNEVRENAIRHYQTHAADFARDIIGFMPDDWQERVLDDLSDSTCRKISVRSGQGVGKTGIEAVALLWFLSVFPNARVVATAPTRQQLNDVLWAEVAKWQNRSPLLRQILDWTKTYVRVVGHEEGWFATARTATKPENMQGFHEDHMLFLVDEASGVAEAIMEAILGTLSGAHNILVLMGNPTQTTGTFYDSHMNPAITGMYRCHRVSSRDVARTDKENIRAMEAKYGRDSNFIRVRVDGEFPRQDDDAFIPLPLLERSVRTEPPVRERPVTLDIACDVARYGNDKTIIGSKLDEVVTLEHKAHGQDTMTTAHRIMEISERLVKRYHFENEVVPIKIDDSGVGGGVTDRLRQIRTAEPERFKWMFILPVIFGQHIKNQHYDDMTTLMMANVRDMLQTTDDDGNTKGIDLILPNDQELIAQLAARKYIMTPNSRMRVESKDKMKERGLPSPDEADCVLMLCLPVDRHKARRRMDMMRK